MQLKLTRSILGELWSIMAEMILKENAFLNRLEYLLSLEFIKT